MARRFTEADLQGIFTLLLSYSIMGVQRNKFIQRQSISWIWGHEWVAFDCHLWAHAMVADAYRC